MDCVSSVKHITITQRKSDNVLKIWDDGELVAEAEKGYNKRYKASLMENSTFVQQHGLEAFMEEQKEEI